MMISKKSKIYIAGHRGMVGSACLRALNGKGYSNIITKNSNDLDLRNQNDVNNFIMSENPDIIINAAAKVGGILANDSMPYDFLMDNMLIQNNLIGSAHKHNIKKFIFLGSSCIYPKYAKQPLKEEFLLSDSLEPTNQWYAIAKISGVKLIQALRTQFNRDYVSLMPTNLYGPNDNFDLETSHVLPALIRKFHDAKTNNLDSVILWGSGSPFREFLHVDDLAQAIILFIENQFDDHMYNVGFGEDLSIKELAHLVRDCVGYNGNISWDTTKPDGTPKKLMDSTKIMKIGWSPSITLKNGVSSTYEWFKNNRSLIYS